MEQMSQDKRRSHNHPIKDGQANGMTSQMQSLTASTINASRIRVQHVDIIKGDHTTLL